jgi:hypothetical protein
MEPTEKPQFDQSVYHPVLFKPYKVVMKITKYTLYSSMLYFACEGFMAWA